MLFSYSPLAPLSGFFSVLSVSSVVKKRFKFTQR